MTAHKPGLSKHIIAEDTKNTTAGFRGKKALVPLQGRCILAENLGQCAGLPEFSSPLKGE